MNKTLQQLASRVCTRLKGKQVCAYGVQITIRYYDWKMITRSKKLNEPLQYEEDLVTEAQRLFYDAWNGEKIRLLGISTYDLVEQKFAFKQLDLFTYKADERNIRLQHTLEKIREKFGDESVQKGIKKLPDSNDFH
ncbi:hypothetical protein [Bacillus sp. JCM 19034]|uniref:DinB/UmuC family translesion DNA polymerase n=1 Tax=Bacillus sp. JCM 19034 TaxID=1481928 RepID=UPI001E2B1CA8|nr:hypothetical protein [Bacillus sp. JCM 19034]